MLRGGGGGGGPDFTAWRLLQGFQKSSKSLLITHITHPSLRACTAMAAYVLRHRAIWAPVLPTRSAD